MTADELWAAWRLWVGIAAGIVVIAASLLITIWLTARRILADAVRALRAAEAIQANTTPIWELQTTNEVAERILATVQGIELGGGQLAGALRTPAPGAVALGAQAPAAPLSPPAEEEPR